MKFQGHHSRMSIASELIEWYIDKVFMISLDQQVLDYDKSTKFSIIMD